MCSCCDKKSDLTLLDNVMDKYAAVPGSLITILQKAQDIYGYLPLDVMYYIGEKTGNSPAKVMGVATFYTQFRTTPVGKHLIMLCQGTACHVNGAERVLKALCEELNIEDGGTSADGLFSLKTVACLGCCSLSPVMMVGEDTYGSLTPDKAVAIIREIRAKEAENL